MKAHLETPVPGSLRHPRATPHVAPSLRIAASVKNRSLLRWLRAVELSAWQDADTRRLTTSLTPATPGRARPLFEVNAR